MLAVCARARVCWEGLILVGLIHADNLLSHCLLLLCFREGNRGSQNLSPCFSHLSPDKYAHRNTHTHTPHTHTPPHHVQTLYTYTHISHIPHTHTHTRCIHMCTHHIKPHAHTLGTHTHAFTHTHSHCTHAHHTSHTRPTPHTHHKHTLVPFPLSEP